ncbi:hypothetical protein LTSEURB_1624, partial [Salmonella enterica subsp. enterica serovar Urbana str. R8-2977]
FYIDFLISYLFYALILFTFYYIFVFYTWCKYWAAVDVITLNY